MNDRAEGFDDHRYRRGAALAMVAMALGYGILAANSTLWDRDEPRFARAAVEMVRSGDYLVPTFNAKLRPDKPAGIYWAMSVPLRLIDNKTLAVRLPSLVGLLCAAGMTFLIGRRMFGGRVGLWAMGMLATALNAMVIGTAATADGVLLAWITLAIWCFIERVYRGPRWWDYLVMTAALGGAQLTKGPVGLVVPALMMLGSAWAGRKGAVRVNRRTWVGLAVAAVVSVVVFLAWAIPADHATAGQFARQGLGHHVIDRILHPAEGHGLRGLLGYAGLAVGFYPVVLIAGFFPWTLMLAGALSAMLRGHLGGRRERAILAGWMVPPFVLMCLVATKLPHYILPIYPALAIACAAAMQAHRQGELSDKDRDWLRGGIWFFTPVAVLLAGGTIAAAALLDDGRFAWPAGVVGAAALVMAVWAVRTQLAERLGRSACTALIGMVVVTLLTARLVLPLLERTVKVSPQIARTVRRHAPADVPVFTYGYDEPSLVFYLDRPHNAPVQGLNEPIDRWLARPGAAVLVTTRRDLAQAKADASALPGGVERLGAFSTINYAGGFKKMTVIVLGRNLAGRL